MDSFNYDSYCGIYCGACDIMMTYKTGCQHRLASFWNESTVKTFHNKLGITYDPNKPFTVSGEDLREYTFKFTFLQSMILKLSINTLSQKQQEQ